MTTSTNSPSLADHDITSDLSEPTLFSSSSSAALVRPLDSRSPPPVKRACDACHRRKVKCVGDGSRRCKNCTLASLTCTYNAVPRKKGPKGSRAKVISELRQTQRQTRPVIGANRFDTGVMQTSAVIRTPGLLSFNLIDVCVDYFFAHLYPIQPILHRSKISETIGQINFDIEAYCLISSLCAYMLIQPNLSLPPHAYEGLEILIQSPQRFARSLLQETIRVRRAHNYSEAPTVSSIITSFFLAGSHFCLDQQNAAWFDLREATTLAQMIGMHEEATYTGADVIEVSYRRRLYWLLFVTERAYALQRHKPLSLHATIDLPTRDGDVSESSELNGFVYMIHLFRPFDDTFVGLWNKVRVGCTPEWLASLQQQLSEALPSRLEVSEAQAVDLCCTQQWLRTIVWQLSIRHGCLSSDASDRAMSLRYPIDICRDLVDITSKSSLEAMEVNGIGLVEKLFDVACTLADVMACVPYEQSDIDASPGNHLTQLINVIASLRGGRQRYLPLLATKISETVPHLAPLVPHPVPIAHYRVDLCDNTQLSTHSATTSGQSSPYGTPPTSAVDCATYGFYDTNVGHAPTSAPTIVTTSMECGNMTETAAAMFPGMYTMLVRPMKFESGD